MTSVSDARYNASVFVIAYAAGNITAQALLTANPTPHPIASHTKFSWGTPAAIVLTLDAPSLHTGTGQAVMLDGADVALVRATVVDARGVPVADSRLNISFGVTRGPAWLVSQDL